MEKIRPMLFTTLKKYSGAQLMSDVVAGIIVAIIRAAAFRSRSGGGRGAGVAFGGFRSGTGYPTRRFAAGFGDFIFRGQARYKIAGPTAAYLQRSWQVSWAMSGRGRTGVATYHGRYHPSLSWILCHFGSLIKFIPPLFPVLQSRPALPPVIAGTIVHRSVEGFLWRQPYPAGMETIEDDAGSLKAFAAWIRKVSTCTDHRRRGVSGDSES